MTADELRELWRKSLALVEQTADSPDFEVLALEYAEHLVAAARLLNGVACPGCCGRGWRTYADTTCGRGGAGGQSITTAFCHECQGRGVTRSPFLL